MAESKTLGQDMTTGPLVKKILLFALPIMAMTCLQLLFNAADMVVVGRFSGKEALGAVGSTTALINLLIGAFLGLSAGTSVTVAQNYGAGNREGISRAIHTSVTVSALCGLVMMAVGVIFCGNMLSLMGTPADILPLATLYMARRRSPMSSPADRSKIRYLLPQSEAGHFRQGRAMTIRIHGGNPL